MMSSLSSYFQDLQEEMIQWRRLVHKHPEPAWCEFGTATFVAQLLKKWGFEIHMGKDLIGEERMNLPAQESLDSFYKQAMERHDLDKELLAKTEGGYTAVAGVMEHGDGPVKVFRVDMDALPITESQSTEHRPSIKQFASTHAGFMHACGHDAHTAIGLGLAKYISEHKELLQGKIIILFQPAEEGLGGMAAVVKHPLFSQVDEAYGCHVWANRDPQEFICGTYGQLASKKFDVKITGKASHAALAPEKGINAMLPAAEIILSLEQLKAEFPSHIRLNIGQMQAGTARNIICPEAILKIETRAGDTLTRDKLYNAAIRTIEEITRKYACSCKVSLVGEAESAASSKELAKKVKQTVTSASLFANCIEAELHNTYSEDFCTLMNHVQQSGGQAVFMGIGASNNAGTHHQPHFDIREEVMWKTARILAELSSQK
ncbi:amidohydrolase [Carboxylicivirga sediminis]|uniref:Amidohydrolase n=1 Tax=Carboxylicivirga sediminis TaxID=2006564 RepID=A0A941IYY8_9BACT|nr:amidohydrolase [Carboxylicivirga sediminis]MBR8536999.1 amidohydrolase [Carboxylicivirga sediminis]